MFNRLNFALLAAAALAAVPSAAGAVTTMTGLLPTWSAANLPSRVTLPPDTPDERVHSAGTPGTASSLPGLISPPEPSVAAVGTASALLRVFKLDQDRSNDYPRFQLLNTSDDWLIRRLVIGLGDTTFNFDQFDTIVRIVDGGANLNLSNRSPDTVNNNVRSDNLQADFTGFEPGDVLGFRSELDPDTPLNASVDFNQVLFGNLPASLSITFIDEEGNTKVLNGSFGGISPVNGVYEISLSSTPDGVPAPGAVALLGLGLGALALRRRRAA